MTRFSLDMSFSGGYVLLVRHGTLLCTSMRGDSGGDSDLGEIDATCDDVIWWGGDSGRRVEEMWR